MTPEQQAQAQKKMQDLMAARQKQAAENAAKAEKASQSALPGVKGTYHSVIDESKIPAQAKSGPHYAEQLAFLKAMTLIVANDGSAKLQGFGPPAKLGEPGTDLTGFTATIDGKPAIVVTVSNPKTGKSTKQFGPISVSDGGATIQMGTLTLKRS